MIVSWYVAELIVVLAAIALMLEAFLLFDCIHKRFENEAQLEAA